MVHDDVSSSDQATVDAVGKATEALEYVERARGHLYAFHQLIGRADVLFEESAVRLAEAGHRDEAAPLWRSLVGRECSRAAGPSRSSSGSTTITTTLPVPR